MCEVLVGSVWMLSNIRGKEVLDNMLANPQHLDGLTYPGLDQKHYCVLPSWYYSQNNLDPQCLTS